MVKYNAIILIDDDEIVRFVVEKIILKAAISKQFVAFQSATEALNDLSSSSREGKNLILLDINMPLVSGWDFLDAFQNLPESITSKYVVNVLSSSINQSDKNRALSYPFINQYLTKPLSVEQLDNL